MLTHRSTYFERHRPNAKMTSETHCARRLSGRARIANFIRCLVNYIYIGLTLQDPPVSRLAEPWTAYHVLAEVQNSLGMAFTYSIEMRSRPKWNAFACSIEILLHSRAHWNWNAFAFACSIELHLCAQLKWVPFKLSFVLLHSCICSRI